jgi:hypothetical protein
VKSGRTLTLGSLALRQMRARWASFVPTALGLAVALGLGTAVALTQSRTEEASLVQTVSGLGRQGLVTVRLTGVRQVDAYNQFTADVGRAARNLGGLVAERSVLLYSNTYTPRTINGVDVGKLGPAYATTVIPPEIASIENLQAHVDLVSGSWPTASTGSTAEATMSEDGAGQAHLKLGDRQCQQVLSPGTYSMCFHVAGIWKPRNLSDPYWGSDQSPPVAAFVDIPTYFAILKAEADADPQPQLVSVATVTLSPDVKAIRAAGAGTALSDLQRLHGQFGVQRPDAVVVSDLELSLDQFVNSEQLAAFAVDLVAVQLLLVALYSVWFLAGNLLAQQRQTLAVWRSRGWSWRGVSLLMWIELAIAALVAAPVGIVGGWLASEAAARAVYRDNSIPPFHFDIANLAVPVLAVLVAELVLLAIQATLAGRHGVLRARAATSRPQVPWWRQRYLDIALAVLAISLLLQLRVLGSASVRAAGAAGSPINLVLPGVAIAFIALAALRLLPLAALGLGRMRDSVAARLASVQLLRAPGQHAALAMLLMLAVALGVFATTYLATAASSGADRAAYAAGADVRGTFDGTLAALPDDIPINGAAARSSVFRGYARLGNEDAAMLAVDPYSFKSVMYTRSDLASSPLPDLVQRLADKETGGSRLPATAKMLSIWVHSGDTGGVMTAHLNDANGRPVHADLGSIDGNGWRQISAPLVADAGKIVPPLRLRDLAISRVVAPGEVAVSDFAVDGTVLEGFSENVTGPGAPFYPGLWWRSQWDTGAFAETLLPNLDVPRDGRRTSHFRVVPAHIPTYLRPGSIGNLPGSFTGPGGAIAALVPAQLLNRFGLAIGKNIQVEVDRIAFTAVIIGVADHFPTLYPELGDFIVLDRDPLLATLARAGHQRPWPNEIWTRTTSSGSDAALTSMTKAPGLVRVYDRRQLDATSASSPQQLELTSNLLLGFVAAIALGLLAFALHFLIVARTRTSDYAVLEANGMSESLVRRSLVIEQLVLLGFCALCGLLLGLAISYVLLPALQLGSAPSDNVPQTIVTIDPALLAVVLGVVVVGAVATGPIIAAATARPRVMSELRSLG